VQVLFFSSEKHPN